ncbi:hypothetical protein [Murimonas intestini]|uniref:Uncharacterized protein n=1 Tax=Murimonas intestini TaxID=1337051 RepID=A0AB73T9X8_9FIRM|nr:hypothetical protein [Murimonas intestini]MCR1839258.1 hypothetical protein [Murimonas intestini]MCR1864554.1 hypothetical protein [Murimonas intestini]MCR1882164.1 hypothetical protein [Murimonas intestini]
MEASGKSYKEMITYNELKDSDKTDNDDPNSKDAAMVSDVQKAYDEALSIARKDITRDGKSYYYGDINVLAEYVEWIDKYPNADENTEINQGAIYRSLAKRLKEFYTGGDKYYGNWKSICPIIFGFEALDTWEEMLPYVENASIYITNENSFTEIMNKLQELECVEGTFDYEARNFDFVISDLSKAVSKLKISDEMLGYILAALDEYGPASLFDGNSFTFKLITNKNVEGR